MFPEPDALGGSLLSLLSVAALPDDDGSGASLSPVLWPRVVPKYLSDALFISVDMRCRVIEHIVVFPCTVLAVRLKSLAEIRVRHLLLSLS